MVDANIIILGNIVNSIIPPNNIIVANSILIGFLMLFVLSFFCDFGNNIQNRAKTNINIIILDDSIDSTIPPNNIITAKNVLIEFIVLFNLSILLLFKDSHLNKICQ